MQQVNLSTCHEILAKPVGELNQMESSLRTRLEEIWDGNIEKFALYAKLSVELDEKGLGSQKIKI